MRVAGVASMVVGAVLIYFVFGRPASASGSDGNAIVPTPDTPGTFDPDPDHDPVALAEAQVGKRYVWGASSDNSLRTLVYDCSSLVQSVFAHIGRQLPRTSQEQAAATTPVTNPRPGDLAFGSFSGPNDHVGIYVGDGKIVSALDESHGVVLTGSTNWPGLHYGRVR